MHKNINKNKNINFLWKTTIKKKKYIFYFEEQ